ncbi:hypothetical protein CDV31_007223 [Fusarium ambrosium]|uniref:D-xylulose reductase n=1 Tax=Fusarium ambrosium TaxID=131363 RepID=A0A428U7R1_9HYPO|nr:hypothetical protein CDV31_007223 [Fusarium ambrosium]
MHSTSSQEIADLGLEANTSCVLIKKQTISIEPMPMPVLKDDGVLVKVMASGICGSDMHAYLAGGVGGRPILSPTVMGHEAAGEVIAVGAAVTTHKIGDRVAIEPGLPCRTCANCKNGRSNICSGTHGTLSRYFTLPADMAPRFPSSISWDEAGSIQPLAIGVQIGKRAELGAHQTLAIFGCGPIGLITAAVAHAYSARKIIAFDISPSRVDFAKKYRSSLTGKTIIDHVFLVDALVDLEDRNDNDDHHVTPGDFKWEQAVRNMTRIIESCGLGLEGGVDRVIEASGAEDAMLNGVAICKLGGIYLQVGLGHIQTHLFPTIAVTNKDLDVRGITRYTASCFPSAIDLLVRGAVDLKSLITARFEMGRAGEALEAVRSGKEIKVIIRNQEI